MKHIIRSFIYLSIYNEVTDCRQYLPTYYSFSERRKKICQKYKYKPRAVFLVNCFC